VTVSEHANVPKAFVIGVGKKALAGDHEAEGKQWWGIQADTGALFTAGAKDGAVDAAKDRKLTQKEFTMTIHMEDGNGRGKLQIAGYGAAGSQPIEVSFDSDEPVYPMVCFLPGCHADQTVTLAAVPLDLKGTQKFKDNFMDAEKVSVF